MLTLLGAHDLRGQLPLRAGYVFAQAPNAAAILPAPQKTNVAQVQIAYPNRRTLDQIIWLVVHHTGDDPNAHPSALDIALFQTGPKAQLPFPGFAYWAEIDINGSINVAWDIETVTWSQGDGSPTEINGVGIYNYQGLAVVFSGRDPTGPQVGALRRIKQATEELLGRKIKVRGHRDVSGANDTSCPGNLAEALIPHIQSA